MKDSDKTKKQLISELEDLRHRIGELEASEVRRKRADEALRESEEHYRALVERALDGVMIVDRNGVITYHSPSITRILGYAPDEVVGKRISDFVDSEEVADVGKAFAQLAQERDCVVSRELRVQHKQGSARVIEGTAKNLLDNPYVTGIVINYRDITERKQAEEALKASEGQYRTLIENANEAIVVAQDGMLKFVNPKATELTGNSREELTSRPFSELIHADDRDMVVERHLRRLKGEQFPFIYPFRIVDNEGDIKWVEISAVLIQWEGRLATLNFLSDITDRKQMEQELESNRARLISIFQYSKEGMVTVDLENRILDVNKAFGDIFGFTRQELRDKPLDDLIVPERLYHTEAKELDEKALASFHDYETVRKRKDGTEIDVSISAGPLRARGQLTGRFVIFRDITERKRAEDALRESEEKYRNLVERSNDGICILQDGMVKYTNPRLVQMWGGTVEEVVGTPFANYVDPDELPKVFDRYQRRMTGEHMPPMYETVLRRKDGAKAYAELNAGLITYEGKPAELLMVRDITDRKRAQEALHESEEKLRRILESVGHGIAVTDLNGIVADVNEKTLNLCRASSKSEVLGKSAVKTIAPRDRERALADMSELIQQGGVRTEQYILTRADGTEYPAEISISVLKNAEGSPVGFVNVIGDITERKKAEEALQESYEIINRSPAVVFLWRNLEGWPIDYVSENVNNLFGYTAEEFVAGKVSYAAVVHPDDLDRVGEEVLSHSKEERKEFPQEYRIITKTGEIKWIDDRSWIRTNEEGEITHYQGIVLDMTERKQAEERERQLQQELAVASRLSTVGEMASGIAHEINNPITSVIGFAQLLMQKDIPDDMKEHVKTINDSAQRVAGIVKRLPSFARQQKPERVYADINDIIETTLAMRAYAMEASNIRVVTQLDPELPRTMADASQLQQVFLNIILNAETEMRLTHSRGKLLVKTERVDNAVRISFEDDGPGIAKENLARLFDPFFTTREVGQGTGLGLSICHAIVAEHNGQIYPKSNLGAGVTFVVELPIVAEEKQSWLPEPAAEGSKETGRARILVVDDEPTTLELLKQILTAEGHEVQTVDNGTDALERIRGERYSLILLDVRLPGMGGAELYERAEKIAHSLATRIVFMTGDVMSEDTMAFLSSAKAPYIAKPFDTEQLAKDINTMLTQRR
jgi:PAS domain S-box-containing protein